MKKTILLLLLLGLFVFIVGCSSKMQFDDKGFLPNRQEMQEHPLGGKYWRAPNLDTSKYHNAMIDPVVVLVDTSQSEFDGVDTAELDMIPVLFRHVITKAMGLYLNVVKKKQPRTIRVQAAITDMRPSNPTMDIVGSVLPVGILLSLGHEAVTGEATYVGAVSYEVKFTDAETGELLGMYMDRYVGKKYEDMSTDDLSHIQKGIQDFAERLAKRLKQIATEGVSDTK